MNDALSFLRSLTNIHINDEDAQQVLQVLKPKQYLKDEIIFQANTVCHEVFMMTKGLVRCHYLFADKEVNLRLLSEPSAVIAFTSYIEQLESLETVQAIEACEGYLISRAHIEALAETIPAIKDLQLYIAYRHYVSMERRLLTIQHKRIEERFEYFQKHMEVKIVERTPAIHVASYLGVPPESLSRAKRELNKR